MKQFFLFVGLSLQSVCFASEVHVQKFQLKFRPGVQAGVVGKFKFQDQDYSMLVDSGASGHGINYKIVEKMKLPLGKTGEGSTPYGGIEIIHVGNISSQLDGVPLELRRVITVKESEGDLSLEKNDIWGAISPSVLADGQLAILDLAEPSLSLIDPVPKNIGAWIKKKYPRFDFEELPRVSGRPYVEIVEATTDRFGKIKMTVDSGATITNIYSGTSAESFQPVSIQFQKRKCVEQQARIRPTSSPGNPNHLLGMDCLRGKILVLPPPEHPTLWLGWPRK